MPKLKATSFIAELADLMSKYDVHLVLSEENDSTDLWLVQNNWEPILFNYDWHDGKITPDSIRKLKP
jgi:hypothetical protein